MCIRDRCCHHALRVRADPSRHIHAAVHVDPFVLRCGQPALDLLEIGEIVAAVGRGELSVQSELEAVCQKLAFALATVVNLFNPAALFVYGRLFELEDDLFARVCEEARRRSLGPSFADCQLVRARGSKRQGAIAGIIEYLTDSLVPDLPVAARGVFQDSVSLRENGRGRR